MTTFGISGKAKLAGVMGWPVSHSRSPRLHGYWLKTHGIDGAYVPLAVKPEDLDIALRALPKLGFRGVNLTIPHKEQALSIVDDVDDVARRIGAINTIVVDGDRLIGRNTDAYGFMENLKQQAPRWVANQGRALVLGAGGAARAIVVALLDDGVRSLTLVNRNRARAEQLAQDLDDPRIEVWHWADRHRNSDDVGLVVNTTSLGMSGQPGLEFDVGELPSSAVVADIVYSPLETKLLYDARSLGLVAVDGLGMLLHQARPGFKSWFGVDVVPDDTLRQMLIADLKA